MPVLVHSLYSIPINSSNQGELRIGAVKKLQDNANRASIYQNLLNSSFQQNFEFCKSDHY